MKSRSWNSFESGEPDPVPKDTMVDDCEYASKLFVGFSFYICHGKGFLDSCHQVW